MEFPDELWKIIKDYQLDYNIKETFFNNLNSEVYSFTLDHVSLNYYPEEWDDDDHSRKIYDTKKNGKFGEIGEREIVTKDSGKSFEIIFKFKHNGVKITETYKIPEQLPPLPRSRNWSKPCYTKGTSLCGDYICKVVSYRTPLYPPRMMAGAPILRIKKKYYTKNKSTNKRYLENTILETKRVRKKPKHFNPNFKNHQHQVIINFKKRVRE